jgi:hypothetical protein
MCSETKPDQTVEKACRLFDAARERFVERYPFETTRFVGALAEDEIGVSRDVVYVDAQLLRLVRYLNSDHPSMENIRHRRIEY